MTAFTEWAGSNEYLLAWLVYLFGVLGLVIVLWRLSRSWPRWLSRSLQFVMACVLLVPAVVEAERVQYAPALVAAPFDWLTKGPELAAASISSLMYGAIGALLIVVLVVSSLFLWRRKKAGVGSQT